MPDLIPLERILSDAQLLALHEQVSPDNVALAFEVRRLLFALLPHTMQMKENTALLAGIVHDDAAIIDGLVAQIFRLTTSAPCCPQCGYAMPRGDDHV